MQKNLDSVTNWDYSCTSPKLSQEFKNKYIIKIKNKEYVLYAGLLAVAHEKGILSLETAIEQLPTKENDWTAIFSATIVGYERSRKNLDSSLIEVTYKSYGDANKDNVSANITKHFIRMAETRAICRVLRNYTNISIVAIEELENIIEIPMITPVQVNKILAAMKNNKIDKNIAQQTMISVTGKSSTKHLTEEEAKIYIEALNKIENKIGEENDGLNI